MLATLTGNNLSLLHESQQLLINLIGFNMQEILLPIQKFLKTNTPKSWLEHAAKNIEVLLVDHAHCEKKAASTALRLIFRYDDKLDLLNKMSRLAREELRHFEMVLKFIKQRKITYFNIAPSNYAKHMVQHIRTFEPDKLIDHLIIGAIIEARSCERFAALAPYLDEDLAKFYISLLKSEGRHFRDYLTLAEKYNSNNQNLDERIVFFTTIEAEYITSTDNIFRFHSGVPE